MALRELLAQFDVGVNTSAITRADSLLGALMSRAATVAGAVNGVGGKAASIEIDASGLGGVTSLANQAKQALLGFLTVQGARALAGEFSALVDEGAKLNDLSEKLGVGTDELQAFAFAVGQGGVEADAAYASLGKLSRVMGDALGGGSAAQDFAKMGVAIKEADGSARPLIDVAGDLADVVKASGSEAEAAAVLTKAFGKQGAALIPAFKGGGKAVRDLAKEFEELGGGASPEFIRQADLLDDELAKLKAGGKGLKFTLANELLPVANQAVKWALECAKAFVDLNKRTTAMHSAFKLLGAGGAAFAGYRLLEAAKSMGIVSTAGKGLIGNLGSLASVGLTGGALIGGLALLYILFDDLSGLINGDTSLLGDWLDETYGLGTSAAFVQEITSSWAELTDALGDPALDGVREVLADLGASILPAVLDKFVGIVRLVTNFTRAAAQAVQVGKELKSLLDTLADPKQAGLNLLSGQGFSQAIFKGDAASNDQRNGARSALDTAFGKLGNLAGSSFDILSGDGANARAFAPRGAVLPATAATVAAGANAGVADGLTSVNQTNRIAITVEAGANAQETANAIAKATVGALPSTSELAAVKRR